MYRRDPTLGFILSRRFTSQETNSAAEQTNIELSSLSKVFEELETWEAELRSSPEIVQKLKSLEKQAPDQGEGVVLERRKRSLTRKPSP